LHREKFRSKFLNRRQIFLTRKAEGRGQRAEGKRRKVAFSFMAVSEAIAHDDCPLTFIEINSWE
jgi:hypothetical protein